MDRYTYIYGTIESGPYAPMGFSENLPSFLSRIGAVNPSATIDTVRNEICGFKELTGYELQPKNNLPVAIRYAPFHLYKRPDMPKSMHPFCALTVSGSEHRPGGRNSVFSQTVFIAREHMHEPVIIARKAESVTFNYLDQLFGTHTLTHEDMNYHRTGKITVDYDALPKKVMPDLRIQDQGVVFNTVNAVYEDQAVIIQIEKGYSFNSRAQQLLTQIYSLLQPHLAAETGFAAYQDPSTIKDLVANTSMRIFILPAEHDIKPEQVEGMLVMDLTKPETIPGIKDKEMENQLKKWSALSWPQRQVAMERLFFDTIISYREKALFLQKSQDFFADPFFVWERSNEDQGSIKTLDELKEKQASFPLTEQIPWVTDRFKEKIDFIMQQGLLKKLTADAIAVGLFSKDEEEKKRQRRRYLYGTEMGGSDVIEACKSTGALVDKQVREECAIELNAQKDLTAKAIADGKAAVVAEQERAAAAAATAADLLNQEKISHAQEKDRMNSEFAAKYKDLDDTTKRNIADLKARYAKELYEKESEYTLILQTEKDTVRRVSEELKKKTAEADELQTQLNEAKADADAKGTKIHNLESKLRNRSNTKGSRSLLIGTVIGFTTALLIGGIIWGIITWINGEKTNEAVTDSTTPTAAETIPEPATESTTEETTTETTETPVVKEIDWVSIATAISAFTDVETAEDSIAQLLSSCEIPAGEIQMVTTISEDGFEAETPELIVVIKKNADSDDSDSIDSAASDPTNPTDETSLRSAYNKLETEEYTLLIFGSDQAYAAAEKLFNQVFPTANDST